MTRRPMFVGAEGLDMGPRPLGMGYVGVVALRNLIERR